ncbi:hypothetical protein DFH06DRAFT_1144301 [Mycena polygramma]|nr:hypothetical protein DFH06DRAFT_1144301 [Mycena polygramma]
MGDELPFLLLIPTGVTRICIIITKDVVSPHPNMINRIKDDPNNDRAAGQPTVLGPVQHSVCARLYALSPRVLRSRVESRFFYFKTQPHVQARMKQNENAFGKRIEMVDVHCGLLPFRTLELSSVVQFQSYSTGVKKGSEKAARVCGGENIREGFRAGGGGKAGVHIIDSALNKPRGVRARREEPGGQTLEKKRAKRRLEALRLLDSSGHEPGFNRINTLRGTPSGGWSALAINVARASVILLFATPSFDSRLPGSEHDVGINFPFETMHRKGFARKIGMNCIYPCLANCCFVRSPTPFFARKLRNGQWRMVRGCYQYEVNPLAGNTSSFDSRLGA